MNAGLIAPLIRLQLANDMGERMMAMTALARVLDIVPEWTEALRQVTLATKYPAREE